MSPDNGGQVTIRINSMEVAGEIIQDLCSFLTVQELESMADFPQEFEEFKKVLMKVDEYNAVRLKLTAEMADSSHSATCNLSVSEFLCQTPVFPGFFLFCDFKMKMSAMMTPDFVFFD
eukprot:EG_transcript_40770